MARYVSLVHVPLRGPCRFRPLTSNVRPHKSHMVGGINPFAILLPIGFAILVAMLLPALVLPWKAFFVYVALGIATAMMLWYGSGFPSVGILVFAAIGLLALAIALPAHVLRKPQGALLQPRPLHAALAFFAVPILTILGIEFGKTSWAGHQLPAGFQHARAIYLPRVVAPSCEMSVWQFTDDEGSRPNPREVDPRWRETPFHVKPTGQPTEDRWLNGIGCSNAEPSLKESIVDAMGLPGSMYLPGANRGFVLLPSRKLLVYSFAN
jgi:hypothetical protein